MLRILVHGQAATNNKKGRDADVKAFSERTLPTLQHHLMLAKRLSAAEKKSPQPPPAEVRPPSPNFSDLDEELPPLSNRSTAQLLPPR